MKFLASGKIYTGKELGFTGSEKTWLILLCDKSIGWYYLNQLKQEFTSDPFLFTPPIAGPHVSITRNERVDPNLIKRLKRTRVSFYYDSYLKTNYKHWWLDVESPQLEEIRHECGLSLKPRVRFHMTVAIQKRVESYGRTPSKETVRQFLELRRKRGVLHPSIWETSPEKEIYENLLRKYSIK